MSTYLLTIHNIKQWKRASDTWWVVSECISTASNDLSAEHWPMDTDRNTHTNVKKWAVFPRKVKLSLAYHSFKLTPPRRAPASRSFWTDYTELSEMLAINVQAVSWQPSLKAHAHQTEIIWKGQRWLKLLTQSALHANACHEAKIWWARQVPQKPFP